MPVEIIDGRQYAVRHVHPTATYPSQGGTATVLGTTYGFTWLHQPGIPTAHGFVEGTYTTRLGDSGEFSVTFPNVDGPFGPWRDRFNSDGATEFLEVYRDNVLEFVGSIQRVEIDRGSVTVSGPDGWGLLRKAYERDRSWTAAPHEVATAYTRVPVAVLADGFDGNSLDPAWTVSSTNPEVVANSSVLIGGGASASITRSISVTSDSWRVSVLFDRFDDGGSSSALLSLQVRNSTPANLATVIYGPENQLTGSGLPTLLRSPSIPPGDASRCTLTIERRGRWVYGYANGELVGIRSTSTLVNTTPASIVVSGSGTAISVYIDEVTVTEQRGFLARGSDLGSYVLPGDMPPGGLRGRYDNVADLQGLPSSERAAVALAPNREPYAERLDPVMNTAAGLSLPIQPGNSGDYFAVRWFGAVYLRGDLGNYTFETTSVVDGNRLWVGKTAWGDQLIDDWTTASGTNTATWTASNYGSKAGWYPIIAELFVDTSAPVFRLQFTPPGTTYTDPGGTSITASTKITIPATSLSPLGCFDNRTQGASHFDLVQQAAQAFGYQITCEPMSLESGEFPGRLVPRIRVGSDTDVTLEPEDTDGVEPALNPGVTIDSTDQAVTLIGSGSGIADGAGGQTTGEVSDLTAIDTGLFALEAWVDAGDINQPALLAARLNAELALRATPWEEVRATPRAQERMADTWPLTGSLAAMRWQPGDGVRLRVPDISVEDDDPRQIIQVTRSFAAEGRTGTQVAFRQEPRSPSRRIGGHLRSALALGRSYQRQKVTLTGNLANIAGASTAAAGFNDYSMIALLPGDEVLRAEVRLTTNSANQSLGIDVNNTIRTTELGGGWTTVPALIDITGYATQASTTDNRLWVRFQNNGGSSTVILHQLVVEVLR